MQKIFICGAGGHGKVVLEAVRAGSEYEVAFVVDDDASLHGTKLLGYDILCGNEQIAAAAKEHGVDRCHIAIGIDATRRQVAEEMQQLGFELVTVIHPAATISCSANIGKGSLVSAGAVIQAEAEIGAGGIINTNATVEHDCVLGGFVHIAPGAVLCGGVEIGSGTLVGAGATVIPQVKVGENVTIGAGATVVRDVPDGATVVGTPARVQGG